MVFLTYVVFFLGVALHIAGTLVALTHLKTADNRLLTLAGRLILCGAVCLALTFLLRMAVHRLVPLSTAVDSLNLFVLMSSATAYLVSRNDRKPLLIIYLPPLSLLCLVTAFTAVPGLSQPPKELSAMLQLAHVGLIFLSFALFFVASLTSFAYLDQVRRLKTHRTTGLFQRLPSLENLDLTLYGLIKLGYPVFAVAMLLGMYWAWYDGELLSSAWWMSPKVLLSLCMALIYALSFHARQAGWLRGPKLAYLVGIGGALLGIFVLLLVLGLSNYNFYGAA